MLTRVAHSLCGKPRLLAKAPENADIDVKNSAHPPPTDRSAQRPRASIRNQIERRVSHCLRARTNPPRVEAFGTKKLGCQIWSGDRDRATSLCASNAFSGGAFRKRAQFGGLEPGLTRSSVLLIRTSIGTTAFFPGHCLRRSMVFPLA